MKKKMLIWESAAFVSGGQRMTLLIIDDLRDQYDIMVIVPEEGELTRELRMRNLSYVLAAPQRMDKGHKSLVSMLEYMKMSIISTRVGYKVAQHFKPSVIYAPGPAALPWAAFVGADLRIPVLWHLHHLFEDGKTLKLLNISAKLPKRMAVIAVSQAVAEQISVNSPVHVFYNPVDCDLYANGDLTIALDQLRQIDSDAANRLIIDRDSIVVGCIGLIQPSKRQHAVIDLAKKLGRNESDHFEFLLVGKALEDSLDYAEQITKNASEVAGGAHVTLVGYHSDINNWLKLMDAIIISSVEGFPLVGLEAMAAGVPLLCIDEGGAAELVRMSGAGLLFSREEAEDEIREKILRLTSDSRFSANATAFAKKMSVQSYTERINELVALLIDGVAE